MQKVNRFVSKDFTIRIAAVDSTQVVREMQAIQNTFPIATVAVGRAMTGAILMASHLKQDQQVGVLFRGNGALKSVYAEASYEGEVRGYTPYPNYEPPSYDKGLSLREAIGHGTLTVARHLPFQKQPHNGTVQLVSGEVGEDIAHYLEQSHQIRSLVNLGIYLDTYGKVVAAGGVIVEVMPGADERLVGIIEANSGYHNPNISNLLKEGKTPKDIVELYMDGLDFLQLDHDYEVKYACPCTKDRVMRALETLGMAELQDMIDKEEKTEITCQMCGRPYQVSVDDIKDLKDQVYKNSLN